MKQSNTAKGNNNRTNNKVPIDHVMVAMRYKLTKPTMVNIPGVDSRRLQESMRATTTTQLRVRDITRGDNAIVPSEWIKKSNNPTAYNSYKRQQSNKYLDSARAQWNWPIRYEKRIRSRTTTTVTRVEANPSAAHHTGGIR